MAIAGTTESYIVEDTATISDSCCLPDHNALSMVKHDTFSNLGGWMQIHSKALRHSRLESKCQLILSVLQEMVGHSIEGHTMKSLQIKQGVGASWASWIFSLDGLKITSN